MNKSKSMRNQDSLSVYQKICLHCCSHLLNTEDDNSNVIMPLWPCVFSLSIYFVQPVKTLSYNIVNLIEDSTYYFRVLAVNAAGEGKPSEESAKVVVKDPKGMELSDNCWYFARVVVLEYYRLTFDG